MSQPPGYYYGGKTFPDSHTYEPEESEVWRAHEVRLHLTPLPGLQLVGYFRLDRKCDGFGHMPPTKRATP